MMKKFVGLDPEGKKVWGFVSKRRSQARINKKFIRAGVTTLTIKTLEERLSAWGGARYIGRI